MKYRPRYSDLGVEFLATGGELVETSADALRDSPVLRMLCQRAQWTQPGKPIAVDDDLRTFQTLLRHLRGEHPDLSGDITDVILLFRCSHKYQCYDLACLILQELDSQCTPETALLLFGVLQPLPELPPHLCDPCAPSAPPHETDLQQSDPEQAEFTAVLGRCFQHCLQVIDGNSSQVLASDALLSLDPKQTMLVAQRDTLQARELEVGRAVLRWIRHRSLNCPLQKEQQRQVLFGSLRLLTMSAKELKKLELDRCGLLTRHELEAVLQHVHHGSGVLPDSLADYRDDWVAPRCGGPRGRGLLQRLVGRTRGAREDLDQLDAAEKKELAHQRRSKRADKIKMALATGASLIFD